MWIQMLNPIFIGWNLTGIFEHQPFIESYFGIESMRGRHPMDGGFHLPLCLCSAALGVWVVGAPQFRDLPCGRILDQTNTGDDVGVTQPYFTSHGEAKELFRRI